MKRLVIMRHAKAEQFAETDFARPLSERGHEQTRQCKKWLSKLNFEIDFALVSSAKRTKQTWEDLGLSCDSELTDRGYNASAEQWVNLIRHSGLSCENLLVVGHNPGLTDLAFALGSDLELGTCGAVVVELDADWPEFGLVSATVSDAFSPIK